MSLVPDVPMVRTWLGKNIEEMSREELLEAFQQLAAMYEDATRARRDGECIRAAMMLAAASPAVRRDSPAAGTE